MAILGAAATAAGRFVAERREAVAQVPADLRNPALYIPFDTSSAAKLWLMRRARLPRATPDPRVSISTRMVSRGAGAAEITLYVYEPQGRTAPTGVLLWVHGGGYIMGSAPDYHANCAHYAIAAGVVVVSVEYRLAPEHPFPAGLEDCYAALRWVHANADGLGVDTARIAVGGDSAGGGLAAALAQYAYDRGEVSVRFQLLVYPMLDDRTLASSGEPGHGVLIWNAASNRFAWRCYLGHEPGTREPEPYAVPARRTDLSGLAPAWIGTGSLDLFHDEDVEYAERLLAAGVHCELLDVEGLYHGGDTIPAATSKTAQAFTASSVGALRAALAAH